MGKILQFTGKELGLKTLRGRPLDIEAVAPLMGYSQRHVRHLMQTKSFPIRWFQIGPRERFVDSADLDDFLSKKVIAAGTAPLKRKKKGVKAR